MADEPKLRSASLVEGVRFTATVGVPNLVQGLFRRRRTPVAIANRLGVDGGVVGLMRGLRRSHAPGPLWIRVGKDMALLLLSPKDVRRALAESPEHFASDPEPKKAGMAHFQPNALTISRGKQWAERREFAEAVLETGAKVHSCAEAFNTVVAEEAASLLGVVGEGELDWDTLHETVTRISRGVIFGPEARDDEELTELLAKLMDEANSTPSDESEHLAPFQEKVRAYVDAAAPGSLAAMAADAPQGSATKPAEQVVHWVFAMGDTLAINLMRALALLGSHPEQRELAEAEVRAADLDDPAAVGSLQYLWACLHEAMRLWPTTPLLARETVDETDWDGAKVPAGTQVLIVNTYHHRDPDSIEFADRFAPEEWTDGGAGKDWSFNHFSHGPQGCPGANLALYVGAGLVARLLRAGSLRLESPKLDPDKPLPNSLDFFGVRVRVEPR